MMKVFLLYAHPEPKSFNNHMFKKTVETLTANGHEIKCSDLYEMKFAPTSGRANFLTIKDDAYYQQQQEEKYASVRDGLAPELESEVQKIEWCDLMIWQFPLWWFGLPGVLKGWVDRVFVNGRIFGNEALKAAMQNKYALLSLTTGSPSEAYASGSFNGEIETVLWPIQRGTLKFVGLNVLKANVVYGLNRKTSDELDADLTNWHKRLCNINSEFNDHSFLKSHATALSKL